MSVPRGHADWLDLVAGIDAAELPVDRSTLAFAIEVAQAYRQEARVWRGLFDEVTKADQP